MKKPRTEQPNIIAVDRDSDGRLALVTDQGDRYLIVSNRDGYLRGTRLELRPAIDAPPRLCA